MLRQYPNCDDHYSKYQCQERKSSASSTASTSSSSSNKSLSPKFSEMSRQFLANTFQRNWQDNFRDDSGYDESLTNLSWLHNVNPVKINEQLSFTPFTGYHKDGGTAPVYPPRSNIVYQAPQWTNNPTTNVGTTSLDMFSTYNQPDFKNNPNLKPPFSYAILISWAMRELRKPKITLSDIYSWIIDNFAYYRHADSSWQNSIRHNLSLGKCFEKVPRRKDEPGKGGFWRINPLHSRTLDISLSKIKYNPSLNKTHCVKADHSTISQRFSSQMSTPSNITYSNHTTSIPMKRSRKSPLTVTQEDWETPDIYNTDSSVIFDDLSNFGNINQPFELSPFDNSSSDSNPYGPPSEHDLSMNHFNDQNLDIILNSPMTLDKDDLNDNDDFRMLTSNNEFSDFFYTGKDDLRELNNLLGIGSDWD